MNVRTIRNKFIGDRRFYRHVMAVAVPIMIQNGISNFVSLLDNIMVGQVGTEEMSGVAIVNQLIFVYYLCIFGGLSGAGIFTAQYFGKGDDEGVRNTFRFKLWMGVGLTAAAVIVFHFFGGSLVELYLRGDSRAGDPMAALHHGMTYLRIMVFGLPAVMIVQSYAGTLRDCGRTTVPMVAGIIAVLVNLVLDYLLIFGSLGLPKMGVAGAATATVIARYVEMAVIVGWCLTHTGSLTYLRGLYRTPLVPWPVVREIIRKGTPLLVNETLWAAGMAMLTQCYSVRGLEAIAAINISNTINNVLNVVFIAMGDAVAILVGQLLGAGEMEKARDTDNKIIAFAVMSGFVVAVCLVGMSFFFPQLYNTGEHVRQLATRFILVQALFTPQVALLHTTYFTMRSGGKTIVTFLFDSVFLWVFSVPVAFLCSHFTGMNVLWVFAVVNMVDWIKCIVGVVLVKRGVWMQTITV